MWATSRHPGEAVNLFVPPSHVTRRIVILNTGSRKMRIGIDLDGDISIVPGELLDRSCCVVKPSDESPWVPPT